MYGMGQYLGLGATLIVSGFVITRIPSTPIGLGAWLTATLLLAFAFLARHVARPVARPVAPSRAHRGEPITRGPSRSQFPGSRTGTCRSIENSTFSDACALARHTSSFFGPRKP